MAEDVADYVSGSKKTAFIPFLLVVGLWIIDLLTGLDKGIVFTDFIGNISMVWRTSLFDIIKIGLGVGTIILLTSFGHIRRKQENFIESWVFYIAIIIISLILIVVGGYHAIIHLLFLWAIFHTLNHDKESYKQELVMTLIFTFIDLFGYNLLLSLFNLKSNLRYIRYILPINMIYVIGEGLSIESNKLLRTIYLLLIFIFIGGFVVTIADGLYIKSIVNTASPAELAEGIGHFWTGFYEDFSIGFKNAGHGFIQLFNTSQYYNTYDSTQETTEQEQGLYLEEIERGDFEYTTDSPVHLWARLVARTLEDEITAYVTCYAETQTIYDDDIIIEGVVDEETSATELEISIFSGVERTIPCIFDEDEYGNGLTEEGDYEIIYNTTFNFASDSRKKIYMMDRDRMLNDLDLLAEKGQDPSPENVLTELYDIQDTDPESVYTSGPIMLAIGTNKLPWDIGDKHNIKPLFGVTVENSWEKGGEISSIDGLYFIMPAAFRFINLEKSCTVPVELVTENSDIKEYRTKKPINNIEDFVTINCHMSIDPDEALDSVPVTSRFLKARAEYTYNLQEKISIEVEEKDLPGVCCESISDTGDTEFYVVIDSENCLNSCT